MERHKKSGVYPTLLLFLFLYGVLLSSPAQAGVQLVPRVNTHGEILENEAGAAIANESYVLFGKYKHKTGNTGDGVEPTETPIIWRVMSADAAHGSQKNAILLTHYVMDKMAYGNNNTWQNSTVQTWLNNTTAGFLTDFSANEKSSMLDYPDGVSSSKVTLPSFWTDDDSGAFSTWIYEGELKDWFGSNDAANNAARRAGFKGASGSVFRSWWARSPASGSGEAYIVYIDGEVYDDFVTDASVAVRPALFLNLESLIFKSGSNLLPSAGAAGEISNPYILYTQWTSAPALTIESGKLMLTFPNAISSVDKWPASTDFTVTTPLRNKNNINRRRRGPFIHYFIA